ncbi:hypothetical protein WOLCODRAFT_167966 [Wolfiporia cocos MD-104 SS10]|uniref:Uncharacterized protein n=1 Tax=Wolfiporia cocos (strain MD-104) TaxID=742152 RepID=A0A2H3JP01_WOLCO|nr:hypothetical protein WOLCODRAFT_167966 [Wolfiporia cocos MD-104 SS10]
MSNLPIANVAGASALFKDYRDLYKRTYPMLRRTWYIAEPWAAARLGIRYFRNKDEYRAHIRADFDPSGRHRPPDRNIDRHNIRRIYLGELSWVEQLEHASPGSKRKRLTPVLEHTLEGREDEEGRQLTFKRCTDGMRAKSAEGKCPVAFLTQPAESMDIESEADMSGQTLIDTSFGETTLCASAYKDIVSMPGGFSPACRADSSEDLYGPLAPGGSAPTFLGPLISFAKVGPRSSPSVPQVLPAVNKSIVEFMMPQSVDSENGDIIMEVAPALVSSASLPLMDVDQESEEPDCITGNLKASSITDMVPCDGNVRNIQDRPAEFAIEDVEMSMEEPAVPVPVSVVDSCIVPVPTPQQSAFMVIAQGARRVQGFAHGLWFMGTSTLLRPTPAATDVAVDVEMGNGSVTLCEDADIEMTDEHVHPRVVQDARRAVPPLRDVTNVRATCFCSRYPADSIPAQAPHVAITQSSSIVAHGQVYGTPQRSNACTRSNAMIGPRDAHVVQVRRSSPLRNIVASQPRTPPIPQCPPSPTPRSRYRAQR